jgi:hypothetical protein
MDRKEVLGLVFEFLISTTIGLITTFWISGTESFIIGLLVFFSIEMVRVRLMVENAKKISSDIRNIFNLVYSKNPITELAILFGYKGLLRLSEDQFYVPREESWEFWRQCLLRTEIQWSVISYSLPEEGWTLAWNDFGLALQKEKIASNCRIERIFLIEDKKEVGKLKKVMDQQSEIGIDVRYISRAEINNDRINELSRRLKTLDFAIVDGAWLFLSELDENRRVNSVGATNNPEKVSIAKDLFKEIYHLATTIDSE